jgi:hypothetical protein
MADIPGMYMAPAVLAESSERDRTHYGDSKAILETRILRTKRIYPQIPSEKIVVFTG